MLSLTRTRTRSRFLATVAASPPTGVPVNTVAPVISGTAQEGQTLSSTTGSWTNSPTGFAYQWRRGGVDIGGATSSTYLLVLADVGALITCAVVASNGFGNSVAAVSNSLGPVAAAGAVPVNTVAPVASGTVRIGNSLTTTDGTWTNSPTGYTYQWRRDGVNISGATSSSYTVVAADIGPAIDCLVTASNGSGSGTPADSNDLRYNLATALFAASEPGFWLDISDATTVFTDTAGTTQANIGDSVARVNDKSGNGVVFSQSSTSARPLLQQDGAGRRYLDFDGSNDGMASTAAVAFSGGDQMTMCVGIQREGDTSAQRMVLETSANSATQNGTVSLRAPGVTPATQYYTATSRGGTFRSADDTTTTTIPLLLVETGIAEISPANVAVRVNGVQTASNTATQGTGNYTDQVVNLGCRDANGSPTFFFDGRVYQAIMRRLTTAGNDLTELEQWVAYRTGVTL